ncbi:helix-turn-helix transcriptional regulator [Flavobacterium sp.]|uniref:helix-turn-helix domain-containing protein n=1 Tax=Flavobacterium sp. TaxID=239 RepID=UPI0026367347|nr:helix-turn-helix transcriptional regulator [Flavobacterium sp.]MDD3004920.1 helix-turn-helix transcriptional regulator [Flavobacterium sp.]
MLQVDDFSKRIEFIMEHFGLNASSFADKIGVQRSSISHILSGRNKPSLDFVLKISDLFSELNLYWLLNGSGSFLKDDLESISGIKSLKNTSPIPANELQNEDSKTKIESVDSEKKQTEINIPHPSTFNKEVQKIVIFYKDGTFDDFNPNAVK